MSRNVKTTSNVKKPFCKVCHDAGKPESEYTNHWVRTLPDRNGKTTVTCPTLLSNECRYCFKVGHTAKFCPVIEQNKKNKERADRLIARQEEEAKKKKVKVEKSHTPKRGFAVLQEDSSDSEVENITVSALPTIVVEEFPALDVPTKTKMAVHLPSAKTTGWAAIAAKPKVVPIEENSLAQFVVLKSDVQIKPVERDYTKKIYTTNWADWNDSDSDEDEEMFQEGPPIPYKQSVSVAVNDYDYDSDW